MLSKTRLIKLSELSILTAIVIVFQLLGTFIHIGPTSISLVLIPIVVGGCLLGASGGAFLGFVFGLMTLIAGIDGTDFFTMTLFNAQPVATALICLGKGTLCGAGAGLVFKALKRKNLYAACILAAAAAPIINTGLFVLGGLFLVNKTLEAAFVAEGQTLVYFVIIVCAGLNFIAELLLNVLVSPAFPTIYKAIEKQKQQ